jgi:diguanylate cyclase (GGDEF)-like protein/PAS domain S-box-containing protein
LREYILKSTDFLLPLVILTGVLFVASKELIENIYNTYFTQLGIFGHLAYLSIEALIFYIILFIPLQRIVQKYNTIKIEYKEQKDEFSKFLHIVGQSADLILITNREGIIEYVNNAYPAITGFSKENFIGNSPALLKSGEHKENDYTQLWKTILSGDIYRDVIKNKRKDGTFFYEEKTITPISFDGDKVTHFISIGKDITERINIEEELRILATTDSLTCLLNRTRFDELSKREISFAIRYETAFSLILFDIDLFKEVNDQHGHDVGDNVLVNIAKIGMDILRDTDIFIRWGGDEFLIIGPQTNEIEAQILTQRLQDRIRTHRFLCGEVTISGGIAQYQANESIDQVIKRADNALYQAKREGRNRIINAKPCMQTI